MFIEKCPERDHVFIYNAFARLRVTTADGTVRKRGERTTMVTAKKCAAFVLIACASWRVMACSAKTGEATILVTTAGTPPVSVRHCEVRRSGLFQVVPIAGA